MEMKAGGGVPVTRFWLLEVPDLALFCPIQPHPRHGNVITQATDTQASDHPPTCHRQASSKGRRKIPPSERLKLINFLKLVAKL